MYIYIYIYIYILIDSHLATSVLRVLQWSVVLLLRLPYFHICEKVLSIALQKCFSELVQRRLASSSLPFPFCNLFHLPHFLFSFVILFIFSLQEMNIAGHKPFSFMDVLLVIYICIYVVFSFLLLGTSLSFRKILLLLLIHRYSLLVYLNLDRDPLEVLSLVYEGLNDPAASKTGAYVFPLLGFARCDTVAAEVGSIVSHLIFLCMYSYNNDTYVFQLFPRSGSTAKRDMSFVRPTLKRDTDFIGADNCDDQGARRL